MGSLRDLRQAGTGTEVAGEQRRDLRSPGVSEADVLGRRPSLGLEAREPGGRVQDRVAEQAWFQSTNNARPSLRQRLSLRTSKCSTCAPSIRAAADAAASAGRWVVEPRSASRSRSRGTAPGRRPHRATSPTRTDAHPRWGDRSGGRRMERVERGEHRVHARAVPGRRPSSARQVLEGQRRGLGRRRPTPRSRGRTGMPSSASYTQAFVAEPVGHVVEGRDLHEAPSRRSGELHHEAGGSRGRRARAPHATRPASPRGHGARRSTSSGRGSTSGRGLTIVSAGSAVDSIART